MNRFLVLLALLGGLLGPDTSPLYAEDAAGAAGITKPMLLSDSQVRGFLDAVDAFRKTGDESTQRLGADPSKLDTAAEALQVTAEAQGILTKHGFASYTDFQRVAYNSAMAYGIAKEGGKEALKNKMEKAKAEQAKAMEALKQQLGAEQAKQIAAQMGAAMGAMDGYLQVPDENITLLKKYAERMDKLSDHE